MLHKILKFIVNYKREIRLAICFLLTQYIFASITSPVFKEMFVPHSASAIMMKIIDFIMCTTLTFTITYFYNEWLDGKWSFRR